MSDIQAIIDSKCYVGTLKKLSNPKTKRYWAFVESGVVFLNPDIIVSQLENARKKVQEAKSNGKQILIICDKDIFKDEIEQIALQNGYHYLNNKVPAGVLTNFDTLMLKVKSMNQLKEFIDSQEFNALTKKERLMKIRQLQKIETVYKGVKNLKSKPDLVIVVDGKYMDGVVDELEKTKIDNIVLSSSDFDRWWDENSLVICNVSHYDSLKYALEYILK